MKCNNQHNGDGELCVNCSSASPRHPNVNLEMNVGRVEEGARVVGVEQTVEGPARQEFVFNLGGEAKKELWNGSSLYLKCNRTATVSRFHDDLRTHLNSISPARVHVYILPSSHQDCPEIFLTRLKEAEFGAVMKGVAANPFAVNWTKEDAKSPDLALAGIQEKLLKGLNLPKGSDYYDDPSTHFDRELLNLAERFDYIFISHRLSPEVLHAKAEKLIIDHLKRLTKIKFIRSRLLLFFFAEDGQKKFMNRLFNPKSCAEKLSELLQNCELSEKFTHCSLPPLEMIEWSHVEEMLMNADEKAIHPDIRRRIIALYARGNNKIPLRLIVDALTSDPYLTERRGA